MTIKELKEKIALLDDGMKVGGSGHYGEFLECWDVGVTTVTKSRRDIDKEVIFFLSQLKTLATIPINGLYVGGMISCRI